MSENKMTFWNLVKLIHPDINPDIKDPETKMELATTHKDNEEKLYILAVKWGLIEGEKFDEFNIKYNISPGMQIKVNQKDLGIVIDIRQYDKLIDVVLYINNGYRIFKKSDVTDQDENFFVIGPADDAEYEKADMKYQLKYGKPQEGNISHRLHPTENNLTMR